MLRFNEALCFGLQEEKKEIIGSNVIIYFDCCFCMYSKFCESGLQ